MSKEKVSLKQVFKDIMWPRRKILLVGLVLILISRTAGFVLPLSLQVLIDDAVKNSNMDLMKLLLIAVMIALTIQAITSFWLTKLLSVEAQHLISRLRVQVQRKILTLPISYCQNN